MRMKETATLRADEISATVQECSDRFITTIEIRDRIGRCIPLPRRSCSRNIKHMMQLPITPTDNSDSDSDPSIRVKI